MIPMTWPPAALPPTGRSDGTPSAGNHATDHNKAAQALADIVAILGTTPQGGVADLTTRLTAVDTSLTDANRLKDFAKLRSFYGDLSNWRNKRVDILAFGDSNFEGYGLTQAADTVGQQMARQLRAKVGAPAGGRGFFGPNGDIAHHTFWPIVPSGNYSIVNTGFGVNGRQWALATTGKLTHTVQAGGITSFAIHYATYGTGVLYYKIDGGGAVNFSVTGTTTVVPTKLTVALPVATTIEIGVVSGTGYVTGIQEFNSDETSGVQVHNAAWSGSYASFWNAVAAPTSWPLAQQLFAPQAVVVSLGGNDARASGGAAQTSATFKANMLTLMTTLKTGTLLNSPTAPIILNTMWSLGDSLMVEPWANYVQAVREIAAADSRIIHVDHSAVRMYPSNGADPAGLYNAALLPHPSAKGAALEAAGIVSPLTPR